MERLSNAEKNIEKIQESVHSLDKAAAVQSEQIGNIKTTLSLINSNMTQMQSTMVQMQSTMSQMQTTLAINTKSLEEHMRRTELLEDRVSPLEKWHWKTLGFITAGGLFGGIISSLVMKFIFKV